MILCTVSEILDINLGEKNESDQNSYLNVFVIFGPNLTISNTGTTWNKIQLKTTLHIIKSPSAVRYHSLILLSPLALESYNLSNKSHTKHE